MYISLFEVNNCVQVSPDESVQSVSGCSPLSTQKVGRRLPQEKQVSLFTMLHRYLHVCNYYPLLNYRGISSVKGELVPHLVRHQGLTIEHTYTNQTKQGKLANVCSMSRFSAIKSPLHVIHCMNV